jgi:hypothetical protein
MITHEDLLAHKISYSDYMKQFLTPAVIARVKNAFPLSQLKMAWEEDRHFNGIRLAVWDRLANEGGLTFGMKPIFDETHEWNTLSVRVSILKRAAQFIVTGE